MSESTKPSPIPATTYIWMNGEFVAWDEARIHVLTHAFHYGTGVFEGIRAYMTPKGPSIFRALDHFKRILRSAKIYRMELKYTAEELVEITKELIRRNEEADPKLREDKTPWYIRPVVYRGYYTLGVNPLQCPVEIFIATWKWGRYLGPEALENGVDVKFSSWQRMAPNTFPSMAKCTANYANSALAKIDAVLSRYEKSESLKKKEEDLNLSEDFLKMEEGISLNPFGFISEGSGENIFIVLDGVLWTPCLGSIILPGITRNSVITLAKEMGIEVREEFLPREMLYIADEAFFTGTAAEITPIRSVDGITIGEGKRGPITTKLQKAFFDIIEGKAEDRFGWHCYVYQ
ncbi:MAG: branched-chain amino acid aminotransferase [candidate division WOR-3 bacterium]